MRWIDFICIAEEQGLCVDDEIDAIEMIGRRFDISYTTPDGHATVIIVEVNKEQK